jgi:hypothetical protein
VYPASTLSASPTSLSFSARQGGASPAQQVVTISNTAAGGPLDWSVGAPSYGQGASGWLSCTPDAGTALGPGANAPVTCSATTGSLSTGTYTASFDISSATLGVAGSPQTVSVTFAVGPRTGITVAPASGLTTNEAGGAANFTVVLDVAPTANVTISLDSSDPGEGSVAPTSLTFTPANWNAPQTVTVTGADDAVKDGNVAYTIVTGATASADADYNGLAVADVSVTNVDDETPNVLLAQSNSVQVAEGGASATYTVVLSSQPAANVVVTVAPGNEVTVAPASLTFTPANWNVPQTVTVTAVDDAEVEGAHTGTLSHSSSSADADYNQIVIAQVTVSIADNDSPKSEYKVP